MWQPEWPISEELRRVIKDRLAKPGISQRAVGRFAGVSHVTINHIANGEIRGSTAIPKICEILNINYFEYLPLDEGQLRLLRALRELRKSGVAELPFLAETESRAAGLIAQVELGRARDAVITAEDAQPPSRPVPLPEKKRRPVS